MHNQEENMFTAVALRGLALLPKYVAHFDVSREKSVVAIEKAMKEEQRLFLVAHAGSCYLRRNDSACR